MLSATGLDADHKISNFSALGLPGAGKTTLARRLEQERPALRLTADEWLHQLHPGLSGDEPDGDEWRAAVERVQWSVALRTLQLGCQVVLDWGWVTRLQWECPPRGSGFASPAIDTE